ncbi:MAG: phosphate regulon sensor histidine kinase PhoR [Gammaproteobacteria bacterium]|nr:phosphate regulon sensor histidine kinase PhoR [Gammaproteobacteria bacterium]
MVQAIVFQDKVMTELNINDQALAKALPAGIIVLDAKRALLWSNPLASELLGIDLSQHKQEEITQVITAPQLQHLLAQAESNTEITISTWTKFYLSIRHRPYANNLSILVLEDVSQLHQLEAMRSSFIANVSHELRTPLTVFRGYLELLLDNLAIEAEKLPNILAQMQTQSQRMESLVENLLLLSRLEGAQPDVNSIQAVNLAALLREIVIDAKSYSAAQAHEFVLELDDDINLKGQADELRSAFSNIVYNAVQYTPAKGQIKIRCYQNKKTKYVSIKDTGIGISEKYIPRITQRFYRIDKARTYRGKGGTGLGLAIVKHVLLRHRGELKIESKMDKGSCFTCIFPR